MPILYIGFLYLYAEFVQSSTMHRYIIYLNIFIINLGCQRYSGSTDIDWTELSVTDIHQAYAAKQFSSEELVAAYLDRIERLDEKFNSITYVNPEATKIAQALDEEYQRTGVLRPLHGIPLIVKDNINTKGLPTTAGALALSDYIAEEDAFIIRKLVDAGAIILAKSNMAEWAFSARHSESSTAGTTHNAYNIDYVPAGSSGGTAVAIALNFGAIGLGTDTGNSIRGPSSHNALVGFRTTLGLVSRSAIVPLYLRNDVVGPMCRTVEDAVKVLEVIAGYDVDDPLTKWGEGKSYTDYSQFLDRDGLKGARIGVFRELSDRDPDPEINSLFDQAITDMKKAGAIIIDAVEVEDFHTLSQDQWCSTFRSDLEAFLATYVQRDTMRSLEDVIRVGTKSDFAKGSLERMQAAKVTDNPPSVCGDAYTEVRRIAFRKAIERAMDSLSLDALIYPTWNNRPARIKYFSEEYKGDNSQIIAPHTGQPAFTVPMGYIEGNLPVGIQFLGRMYSEPTLIKLTYGYEQETKHRVPPNL
jgi:amidase